MVRRNSKYSLNPLINPVGNVKPGNPTHRLEGAQEVGRTQRQACVDGRSTELKSKWAASQPRDADPRLQDRESEHHGILESRKTQVISSGFTPGSGTVLSPALLDPHRASDGHSQSPPPPLEAVHCITSQPGWKVLSDFSQMFPLLLVLLPGPTHNEAVSFVTGLTTLEKSAARYEDHSAHLVSLCPHPTMALS